MHKRFIVYGLFLEKFKKIISNDKITELRTLNRAEKLRFRGKWFDVLLLFKLSFKNKIRFIFHSNKFLYWIRIKLFSLFSGWG